MSQTAVAEQALGFPGQKRDSGFDDIISQVAEGDLVDGTLGVEGTDVEKQAQNPSAAADITTLSKIRGVVVRSLARESNESGEPRYLDKAIASLMRRGRVLVKVEEAVTPDSPVFVRHAAGAGGTVLGAFRASADTASAAQVPAGSMQYRSSAGAGELAVLEVTLS